MGAESPLSGVSENSLDEYFSSKPPYSPQVLAALVSELRRMREKWQVEEREGKAKRAKRVAAVKVTSTNEDIFGGEGGGK
jgi:hypothetical protein